MSSKRKQLSEDQMVRLTNIAVMAWWHDRFPLIDINESYESVNLYTIKFISFYEELYAKYGETKQ